MTYKIAFFDIDGTILRSDHTYDKSTKDAIDQLHNQGIQVVLATGRPLHELDKLGKELNVDAFIGYNGTYAVYKNDVIVHHPFDSELIKKILEVAYNQNDELLLYTNQNNLFSYLKNVKTQNFIDIFYLINNCVYFSNMEYYIRTAQIIV